MAAESHGSEARSLCWNCQSDVEGAAFCGSCVKVLPISERGDYFEYFGLSCRLNIDLLDLERRFHALSRKFHPDFYQSAGTQEKAISLENSAAINRAYRVLRDPVARAEYVVQLESGAAKQIPAAPPQDLLMEMFDLQEALQDYRAHVESGQDAAELLAQLTAERQRLERRMSGLQDELAEAFSGWDRLADEQRLEPQKGEILARLKRILGERAYLSAVLEDLTAGLGLPSTMGG